MSADILAMSAGNGEVTTEGSPKGNSLQSQSSSLSAGPVPTVSRRCRVVRGRVLHLAWGRGVGAPVLKCRIPAPIPNHAIGRAPTGSARNDAMMTSGRFPPRRPLAPAAGGKSRLFGPIRRIHANFRHIDVYLLPTLDDVCLDVYWT